MAETTNLVDLGSYKLEVTIRGPPRRAHNPIVIIIPDIACSIKEWAAVTQLLAESMSVVNYERGGFGQSELPPESDERSAKDLAQELHTMLRVGKMAPPYIVVAHADGGIILREFIKLRNLAQFKGFVFVDGNTGQASLATQSTCTLSVMSPLNSLRLCYEGCHRMGDRAWQALMEEMDRFGPAVSGEIGGYYANVEKNGEIKKPANIEQPEFGRVPLYVLHGDYSVDWDKMEAEAERLGYRQDSEKETDDMRMLRGIGVITEDKMKALRSLSERFKFEYVGGVGQRLHLSAPEKVADAVTWILMQYRC
ncbi:hypothetical protein FMUND_9482 [Fusarium mundagurra]|uniref:AB hydrolase-1 domain-containing protein n=1 Tax=Fusarium mundagurra TaxID=1567541 RepID=A0A8H5YFM2_9HYPO|nr:hypothetical protein FMUND_9482 [Fusarium mundagurra]